MYQKKKKNENKQRRVLNLVKLNRMFQIIFNVKILNNYRNLIVLIVCIVYIDIIPIYTDD